MKYLPLLNFDKTFHDMVGAEVIPTGVEALTSKKQVSEFMKYVFSNGDAAVNLGAVCDCGCLKGMYLEGSECPDCKTVVKQPTAVELRYTSWLEIPDYLPPLLHPAAMRILSLWMGKYSGTKTLQLLITPGALLPDQLAAKFTPGLWEFYNRFDEIIDFMLAEYKPTKLKINRRAGVEINQKSADIRRFVTKYRDCIFARHFPVLDQSMHTINKQGTMTLVDPSASRIMKCIIELANIQYKFIEDGDNITEIEELACEMLNSYQDYSDDMIINKLSQKEGIIRRHILGARCHFTARGVIVPTIGTKAMDELHLPWGIGVQQHKLEIINLLVNRNGYTPHEAQSLYEKSKYNYNELIDSIMQTLIEECPYKGLPVILGRNPSLVVGAIQTLFVTKIKTENGGDITDDTIAVSDGILTAPNGDYDGDALYLSMIKEMDNVPYFLNMHPKSTMLTSETLEISSCVNIGDQCSCLMNNWLNE